MYLVGIHADGALRMTGEAIPCIQLYSFYPNIILSLSPPPAYYMYDLESVLIPDVILFLV